MFRLKIPRTQINFGFPICRNYLSNEYKSALSDFVIPSIDHINYPSKGSTTSGGLIRIDLVSGIAHGENRTNEFTEAFLKLRSEPLKATVFEATNYAIFRNFIDHENIDELLPIIKNRLQSGVIVEDFIGCYLLNQYLQAQNYLGATELGLEIYKQETLNNKLVVGLILKSFFEYLKQNIEQIIAPPVKETKPKKKSDEVKIRVKFVRNSDDSNDLVKEIGKAFWTIAKLHPNNVTTNFKLLGSLLNNKFDVALSLLLDKNINFCKEALQLSQTLLKNKDGVEDKLINAINSSLENQDSKSLDFLLTSFIEEVKKVDEAKLIEQQKQKYAIWKNQDAIEKTKDVNVEPPNQRKERIGQILADLSKEKQKLWYFDNEELIDLQIFQKNNKSYPKRWFGKKKSPRVVDDNYIPPETKKKHA